MEGFRFVRDRRLVLLRLIAIFLQGRCGRGLSVELAASLWPNCTMTQSGGLELIHHLLPCAFVYVTVAAAAFLAIVVDVDLCGIDHRDDFSTPTQGPHRNVTGAGVHDGVAYKEQCRGLRGCGGDRSILRAKRCSIKDEDNGNKMQAAALYRSIGSFDWLGW